MSIPKIIVKKVDFDFNVKYITNLLTYEHRTKNTSLPFAERVFGLIPQLKVKITDGMKYEEIYTEVYLKNGSQCMNLTKTLNLYIQNHCGF